MGTRAAFPDPWNPVSQPGQESPSAASHWPVCYFDVVHLTDRFFFDFFFSFFFFSFFLFRLQLKRSFLISRSAIRFPSISLFLPTPYISHNRVLLSIDSVTHTHTHSISNCIRGSVGQTATKRQKRRRGTIYS